MSRSTMYCGLGCQKMYLFGERHWRFGAYDALITFNDGNIG